MKPIKLTSERAWRTYLGGNMLDSFHGREVCEDSHFPEEWIMSTTAAKNAGREHIRDEGMSRDVQTHETLQMVDSMVTNFSQIFLYVGLVFAVFAVLLLSDFISTSISQKKREIGILRAVGARSADVFKIFFSESFVIAAICVAISTAASVWLCDYLNKEMASGIGASLLVFGPLSVAVLIGSALLTVIVATFLPVNNAARKKPVESIKAL